MEFKNKQNRLIVEHLTGKEYWHSRSVAVNGTIIIFVQGRPIPYVLVSERGPNSADFQGLLNVVAGYLDWDESGTEAIYRETWEETGLDLKALAYPDDDLSNVTSEVIRNDLENPWHVKTDPWTSNRQNVSLRYGFIAALRIPLFPEVNLENNEVEGEVSKVWWMPVNEIDRYEWAFDHDKMIKDYLARAGLLKFVHNR